MNILEQIVDRKREEVEQKKFATPCAELKFLPYYNASTVSLIKRLKTTKRKMGIIAEMKKASPSKGIIIENYAPQEIFLAYQAAEVEGISILTDKSFFQGDIKDLFQVRKLTSTIPLLRKDFIIDSYQITEAKGYGASVVLLIAAILEKNEYQEFYLKARELNLEVITEVHSLHDLKKVFAAFVPEMIGINNRDLTTFRTSIEHTKELVKEIPDNVIVLSESGINSREQIEELKELGVRGVLVGEYLGKEKDRVTAIKRLVGSV